MFLQNKYTQWYHSLIQKAQSQNRKKLRRNDSDFVYYESHHVIPLCMGGTEEVLLTAKEHYVCHLLLPKMFTGNNKHKMINALIRMAYSKSRGQERYVSRTYSVVRAMIAEKNVEKFKGKPKKHTNNGKTGKWVRTKKHRQEQSERQKGKRVGEDNPFYGKKHSKKTKLEWSKKRKGVKAVPWAKGKTWYYDGNKRVWKDDI